MWVLLANTQYGRGFAIVELRNKIFASGQSAKILSRENFSPYGMLLLHICILFTVVLLRFITFNPPLPRIQGYIYILYIDTVSIIYAASGTHVHVATLDALNMCHSKKIIIFLKCRTNRKLVAKVTVIWRKIRMWRSNGERWNDPVRTRKLVISMVLKNQHAQCLEPTLW